MSEHQLDDDRRLFQRLDRKVADVLRQDLDSSRRSVEAPNASRSQVTFEVGVQEACNALKICRRLFASRLDPRFAPGLDLADEQPFSVAHLLHGLYRALFARFSS